jgi:hypothetical protein
VATLSLWTSATIDHERDLANVRHIGRAYAIAVGLPNNKTGDSCKLPPVSLKRNPAGQNYSAATFSAQRAHHQRRNR